MHTAQAPDIGCVLLVSFSVERTTPPPREQSHPSKPHEQRAFTSRPRTCKSVLEGQRLAPEGSHVQDRGVVDQEEAGQRRKGQRNDGVQGQREGGGLFVKAGFPD